MAGEDWPVYRRQPWLPDLVAQRMTERGIAGTVSLVHVSRMGQISKKPYWLECLCVRCNTCNGVTMVVEINRRNAVHFRQHLGLCGVSSEQSCKCGKGG